MSIEIDMWQPIIVISYYACHVFLALSLHVKKKYVYICMLQIK